MSKPTWKMHFRPEPQWAGHALFIIVEDAQGVRSLVTKMEMELIDNRHAGPGEPCIPYEQAEDFLQAALDAAWEAGMRPRGFQDHTNELTAVRYHLEDMRKLAFEEPTIINEARPSVLAERPK